MKLSFPDINPEVWNKMMNFHKPGGSRKTGINDFCELLPIFDKYAFRGAVEEYDIMFLDILGHHDTSFVIPFNRKIPIAVLCFEYDLPLSKSKAVEYAKSLFQCHYPFKEKVFRSLIPSIKDDEATLRDMALVILREEEAKQKNLEELQEMVKEESFPSAFFFMAKAETQGHCSTICILNIFL